MQATQQRTYGLSLDMSASSGFCLPQLRLVNGTHVCSLLEAKEGEMSGCFRIFCLGLQALVPTSEPQQTRDLTLATSATWDKICVFMPCCPAKRVEGHPHPENVKHLLLVL